MAQETIEVRKQGSFPNDDPTRGLEHDHRYVRQLFDRYLTTRDQQVKQQAGPAICEALTMHTSLEEAVFYPRVQETDTALVERCIDEHHDAEQIISQLQEMEAGKPDYDDLIHKLHEAIMDHIKAEEEQLFPAVRDSGLDLQELSVQMQAYESNLISTRARESQGAQRPEQRS